MDLAGLRTTGAQRVLVRAGAGRWAGYAFAVLVGAVLILALFPPDLLASGTVPDARLAGDVGAHVAGQRAFIEDGWHWPLLKTTLLDWPAGLNIAMTDGNPLVALPLKLVSFALPAGFSAVQLWLALAYLLQPVAAVFALRSAGERRLAPAVAVALFAVSMPTFLFRHPHSALSSHFVLLLALGGYFRAVRGWRGGRALTLVLLPASFLIHPYLAVMTAALLAAAPVTLALRGDRRWRKAALTFTGAVGLTVLAALLLGYQAAQPPGGFGEASMNLISPFQPAYSYFFGNDVVFIDATGAQYEGYQYLGLGLLLLLLACVVAVAITRRGGFLLRHWGLVLVAICLTALAISDVVYFERRIVLDLSPVPGLFQQIRASGRLFWPVTYLLLVAAVAVFARLAAGRVAAAVLVLLALVQVADAAHLRWVVHHDLRARMAMPLDAGRLDQLLEASTRLTMSPSFGCGADANRPVFMQLILAATRHKVSVNTMYVARFATLQDCRDSEATAAPLAARELRVFLPIEAQAGPATVPNGADLCRRLQIVAVCTRRTDLLAGLPAVAAAMVPLGPVIPTTAKGLTGILGAGWYLPEPVGVWSVDRQAVLVLQAAFPPGDVVFEAVGSGFTGAASQPQGIALLVNGHRVAAWNIPNQRPVTMRALIPADDLVTGPQVLRFEIANPTRPSDAGTNRDTRQLGVFLASIRLTPAGAAHLP